MLIFVIASDVTWLFVARITQGVATGLVTSALAAALVDLQPSGRQPPLALVRGGVSAVAAMQYEISDPAAVAFARGFYGGMGQRDALDAHRR